VWTKGERDRKQKKKCLETRKKRQKLKALLYVDKAPFGVEKLEVVNNFF